jgi:hypothetical protein
MSVILRSIFEAFAGTFFEVLAGLLKDLLLSKPRKS